MAQLAPRVLSIAVVREHSPAYGLTPDGLSAGDVSSAGDADAIEALGDEISTLAAHMVRGS
ncbi:MAG: hypothetical protein Q8N53_03650 [Longimicrobiales bacterium]|nr:hypothetical protein [Longimicrobiales bacterium]